MAAFNRSTEDEEFGKYHSLLFGDVIIKIIITVTTVLLCPLIVFGNTLVFASFIQSHRVRTPSNQLLLYLGISDFLLGLLMPTPLFLRGGKFERIVDGLYLGISITSLSFMVSIALDKAFSLAKPLTYTNLATKTNVHFYSFFLWLSSSSGGGSLSVFVPQNRDLQLLLLGILFIPCIALASACYLYIYAIASKHVRAIRQVEVSVRCKQRRDRLLLDKSPNNDEDNKTSSVGRRKKTIKIPPSSRYGITLSLTVALLLGSRLPGPLGSLLAKEYTGWNRQLLELPVYFCSACNPWVYAFHNLELKIVMKRVLKRLKKSLYAFLYRLFGSENFSNKFKRRFMMNTVVVEGSVITHCRTSHHHTEIPQYTPGILPSTVIHNKNKSGMGISI